MKKIFITLLIIFAASLCFAYNISSGDELDVKVINLPEASDKYEVSPDGSITVPYAGKINVLNATSEEVAKLIQDKLAFRIKDPEVYVSILKATNNAIFITGMVKKPGSIKIEQHSNLATIVAAAGDIDLTKETANMKDSINFTIKSLDGEKIEVQYKDIIECNYVPRNGDVIIADFKGKVNVNVVGNVNAPGRYILSSDNNTLMSAIVMAGGLTQEADYGRINVYNLNGEIKTYDISNVLNGSSKGSDVSLENNSTIIIPELTSGITVLGWVNKQGKQLYRSDAVIHLADVIAEAGGGVRNKARFAQVWVLREVNGQITRTAYDFNAYQKKGDITGNPILKNGDVVFMPTTDKIQWLEVVSSFSSLINFTNNLNKL